jgi:hypothetical protein
VFNLVFFLEKIAKKTPKKKTTIIYYLFLKIKILQKKNTCTNIKLETIRKMVGFIITTIKLGLHTTSANEFKKKMSLILWKKLSSI